MCYLMNSPWGQGPTGPDPTTGAVMNVPENLGFGARLLEFEFQFYHSLTS